MNKTNYFMDGLTNKDEKVILDIYKTCFPSVLRFVQNNNGNRFDAEDVFQKALMQIMARLHVKRFEITSSFEPYLFVACKNLWRKELIKKKKKETNRHQLEHVDEDRDLALSTLEQERWEFFQEKLKELSDNCKFILEKFFNKVPYKKIAKELGYTSESVVRQRVFKCKGKLTKMIREDRRYKELKNI